jgi:uncharacterized protein YprB with RNaseH-like and TPR domain
VPAAPTAAPKTRLPSRYQRLADTLGGELVATPTGTFCLVTTTIPFGFSLGRSEVPSPPGDTCLPLSSFSADDLVGDFALSDILCFDTETTGLGGAGAVAFLVGFGSLTADGFEIRQYVLPDYSDETALLESTLDEFRSSRTLISYNGQAFDMSLLRDRMIVNRVARDIPHRHHIDLLHAGRRLFRRRLKDCSLTNIERELFDFHRADDIPGYLIPSVYFDWLATESADHLPAVLEHNRWDILTLYLLLLRVAEVFSQEGAGLDSADDLHSLSRVYGRRRQLDKVAGLYRRIEQTGEAERSSDLLWYHAMNFKRCGDWDRAVALWQQLSETGDREAYLAHLELAKFMEHRRQAPDLAFQHAQKARALCPDSAIHREELRRRLARLSAKLKQ